MNQERIEEILEEHLYVTDEWGGSKLANWRYGHNVVVSGIDEAAAEIMLSGWTFITNDPATLPPASTSVSLAYETTGGKRRITSAFIHIYKDGDTRWHITDSKAFVPPWWEPYAWREWPTPPPLPGERGE